MPPLQTREAHVKTSFIISLFIVETRWNIGKCWLGAKYGRGQVAKILAFSGYRGLSSDDFCHFNVESWPPNMLMEQEIYKTHDCGFFWSAKKSHLPHFSPPDLFLPGQTVTLVWVRSKTICFFSSIAWARLDFYQLVRHFLCQQCNDRRRSQM